MRRATGLRDVSAPLSDERALSYAARMYALTAALSEALTPEEVAHAVLAEGIPALRASAGLVSVLGPDGKHLSLVGSLGYAAASVQPWQRLPAFGRLPIHDAVRTHEPVWIRSREDLLEQYPPDLLNGNTPESFAWAVLPMVLKGRVIGAITFGFSEDNPFPDTDRHFAVSLAHQCAQALERARLYESERVARLAAEAAQQRFALLAEASDVLGRSRSEVVVFSHLVKLVIPRLADWLSLRVFSENGELMPTVLAHVDPAKESLLRQLQDEFDHTLHPDHGVGKVLRTHEPSLYGSIPDDLLESGLGPEMAARFREVGMRGSMTVALLAQGKNLGVLTLASTREDRVFCEEDLLLTQDLARRLALAIDSARTHAMELRSRFAAEQSALSELAARRRAEKAAERTAALQSVTAALSEAATPFQVAKAVISQAITALGAVDGAVWELRPEDRTLEMVFSLNFPAEAVEAFRRIPLDSLLPAAVAATTGAPIWLASAEDAQRRFSMASVSLKAAERDFSNACLPLMVEARAIGVISLTFSEPRTLSLEEQAFLTALAVQCTHALERARLYLEAQEAISARDEFLSIASHELKTPLTSLKLQIQTATQGKGSGLTERSFEKLRRADRQIHRLTELIERMLDLSRVRTGTLRLDLLPMNLVELIKDVVSDLSEQAQLCGSALELTLGSEVLVGSWDRLRVGQVVTNLLVNALKYGKGNPVQISLETVGTNAVLTVADRGIGIGESDLLRLFQPYQRAASGRHLGGLGLGLFVTRRLVEGMGGTIAVSSKEGEGSRFVVSLPLSAQ